mgnify:CR=1 FL=1
MRALGYFTYDPSAAPGSPRDRSALTAAFEAYCVNGSHNNQGAVAEAVADEAHPLWGDMVVRQVPFESAREDMPPLRRP